MTDNQNLEILIRRFEDIASDYSSRQREYIHFKSVNNFLFQLDKLNSDWTQQKIYSQLSDYFDLIQENFIDNKSDAILLFDKRISPIAKTYNGDIQFRLIIKIQWVILITLLLTVVLLILKSPFYYFLFLIVIDLLLYIRQLHFEEKRISYGPFY